MSVDRSLTDLGVVEVADGIRAGAFSSEAVVQACLDRIEALDRSIRAWALVDPAGALAAARERDLEWLDGRSRGPLHGVPVGIKDIIDVAGMPTTAGAAAFAHRLPDRDAGLVTRLRAAGAVILGKTHATQFAYRDAAPTRNPWALDHTPGGSSSGSAAAVAARMVPAAIGTQTVGSILRPAAYCGVVGLKGPFGAVPLDGVVPLAWSLDHAGPIARSVADAAVVLGGLTGLSVEVAPIERPRFAVARELVDAAESSLRAHLGDVIERLREAGASVVEVELPASFAELAAAGGAILEMEAAAYHRAAFAEHEGDYGPAIADLVRAGLARPASDLAEAEVVRARVRNDMAPVLAGFDALVGPVAPGPAPLLTAGTGDGSFCAPWSTLGVPSLSLPTGQDSAGLPLATQFAAGVPGPGRMLGAATWAESTLAV